MHVGANSKLGSLVPRPQRPHPAAQHDDLHGADDDLRRPCWRAPGIRGSDLLQIDTEGYDWHVLRTFDLGTHGPVAVNMEFYCLPISERLATFALLRQHGYAYRFDGMDLLAVQLEQADQRFLITDLTDGRFLPAHPVG